MNILVTGVGGATPRAIARRIRQVYPNAKIIGTDLHHKALGFHIKGLVDEYYIVPKSKHEDYWKITADIINKHSIDLAFVQPETEVITWGEYYETHGQFICPTVIPPAKLAKALIDKANMADVLKGTKYIPKTVRMSPSEPKYDQIQAEIGYPCWIRATQGSGGFGSLKLNNQQNLEAWLLIHQDIKEFTVSEFLSGKHLANQMLYIDGRCIKNGGLECVEYVMANVAPSKVTGNTSYGRFINDPELLSFCEECIDYICKKMDVVPHGVLSFDLKEDSEGNYKVTEVNIRHMAYTETMARAGFDLVSDSINYLLEGENAIKERGHYQYAKNFIFLRDVDIEPILMEEHQLKKAELHVPVF